MKIKSATIGILGGGQLGRMSAMAAHKLGLKTVIFTPEENSPAAQVCATTIVADYTDKKALQRFFKLVDVVTFEFENIPLKTIEYIEQYKPVAPSSYVLAASQHRVNEKAFLNAVGIKTARYAAIKKAGEIEAVMQGWGIKTAILKTCRMGYDGKGQVKIDLNKDNTKACFESLKSNDLILEEVIDFTHEISCIVARDVMGRVMTYPIGINTHKNHILDTTIIPAKLPDNILKKARAEAIKLAKAVDLVGVLTLEMFITKDGKVLANEIAPRTHNSGHWTIEGCNVSQFENHIRAVAGLPVIPVTHYRPCKMINLIGSDIFKIEKYAKNPQAHIHLYGKDEVREGRKMGHITVVENKFIPF